MKLFHAKFARTGFAPILGLALALSVPSHALKLEGKVADGDFSPGTPLRIEVLESGDSARTRAGEAFVLPLPADTLWNICIRRLGQGNASDTVAAGVTQEKCFELRRPSASVGDSVIHADLGGSATLIVAADTTTKPVASELGQVEAADSTLTGKAAGTETSEEAVTLKKVLVRAQRAPKRALGRQTVSAKLIKRMPGLAEADVIRSIQGLPGVVASSDFSTKIYVRGGGSDQNLILFDNASVYSPVHLFGLFSTFLVEGIDDVTFYKSGFPAEYGGRLSSVLDIKSRKGGNDTANSWMEATSVKVSTFATQLHTEGRQDNWRWLLAGRTTYVKQVIDYLRGINATDLVLDYYFYDIQGGLNYSLDKDKGAMLTIYQGRDRLDFSPFVIEWGNTIIPFNLNWKLGDHLQSRSTLSYSLLSQTFGLNRIFEFYNKIITWQVKQSFDYDGIEDHKITAGVEANYMRTVFRNSQTIAKTELVDRTNFYLTSLYFQDKWNLNPWEISPNLRLSVMSTLDGITTEPRLTVKRQLPWKQSIDFHVGWYEQFINSILFTDQESLNEFYYPAKKTKFQVVNPTSSLLLAVGWSKEKWLNRFDLSLEGYYKTLNHLAVFAPNEKADSVTFTTDRDLGDLFKEAEGYSLGYETSVRHPDGLLFGGISYSQGYSVIQEQNRPESYFPKWHQPHSFKGDLGINWSGKDGLWVNARKGRYFRSSMQLKYATGLPYTEYSGYIDGHFVDQNTGIQAGGPNPEFQGNIQLQRANYNQAFVVPYFRWDAKVIDWGKEGKWNFSFTILNLTNHENVLFPSYDRSKNPPEKIDITQFPRFPFLLNYEWYF